ncbi:hypothetical protein [Lysobacter gummosus]|uniref:hypothetical protein n=1 Tax=Lysobacter gummosus TaxID=262324 RepID=UPI00363BA153
MCPPTVARCPIAHRPAQARASPDTVRGVRSPPWNPPTCRKTRKRCRACRNSTPCADWPRCTWCSTTSWPCPIPICRFPPRRCRSSAWAAAAWCCSS